MEPVISYSQRGQPLLVVESANFVINRELKSGETSWRCAHRNCKAKVYTVGRDYVITRKVLDHSHEVDVKKTHRQLITAGVKRKATDDIHGKPSKIIHLQLNENKSCLETFSVKDQTYVRTNLYNQRRKILPPLPKNMEEIFDAVENLSIKTIKEEDFLFISDRSNKIIVFSCYSNIRTLCQSEKIYADGTFSHCAKYFYQLFTLHILMNGHYIPLVFCLLPDKRQETYKCLFQILCHKCQSLQLILRPQIIVIDFELAIHNACRSTWSETKIRGCKFHLTQAWYRNIQKCGLVGEYKDKDSEIGRWLHYIFGLCFLNPDEVGDCYCFDLNSIQPQDKRVERFSDYLVDNFISEDARFPPELWAQLSESIERSTNACEAFHSKFNSSFYNTHPSIFTFTDVLLTFQTDTYIKLQSLNEPVRIRDQSIRKRQTLIARKIAEYQNGLLSRLTFIKCLSFLNSAH